MVRGEMVIEIDGVERTVRPGDAIYLPAGCAHAYANRGAAEVEFLCVVRSPADYSTEWLEVPPTGRCRPDRAGGVHGLTGSRAPTDVSAALAELVQQAQAGDATPLRSWSRVTGSGW